MEDALSGKLNIKLGLYKTIISLLVYMNVKLGLCIKDELISSAFQYELLRKIIGPDKNIL